MSNADYIKMVQRNRFVLSLNTLSPNPSSWGRGTFLNQNVASPLPFRRRDRGMRFVTNKREHVWSRISYSFDERAVEPLHKRTSPDRSKFRRHELWQSSFLL